MESEATSDDLVFEDICESGVLLERLGRSKVSGVLLLRSKFDKQSREIEKLFFDDDCAVSKRIKYEYDADKRPKLVLAYDKTDKLIFRHERGKRPEITT